MLGHSVSESKHDRNSVDYAAFLKACGMNAHHFEQLDAQQKHAIQAILDDLAFLNSIMPNASSYEIINLADVLFAESDIPLSTLLSTTNNFLNNGSEKSEKILAFIYLGLSCASLAFSIASAANCNPCDELTTMFGSGWNYADGVGSIGVARQFNQGEILLGSVNFIGNIQSLVCTIIANISQYTALMDLSTAAVTGLLGFSGAAGMWISFGSELYEIHQCNNRIRHLENKLSQLSAEDRHSSLIHKAILIEKGQRENHIRAAKSWAGCAVAMTAIAIVSYIAVSGMTFGALPAVTVLLASVALVTALIRKWWVGRDNHVDEIKNSLQQRSTNQKNCRAQMDRVISRNIFAINFDQEITLHGVTFFGNPKITFRQYLEKLLIHDAGKLQHILNGLENETGNRNRDDLVSVLRQHHMGEGVGEQIARALMSRVD